jgi:hypothetical protein
MNQMHHIRDGLKRNLGAVKGASAGSGAGGEQPVTAFFSITARLGLICGTTRLAENLLDF